jgi:hypothetical protein
MAPSEETWPLLRLLIQIVFASSLIVSVAILAPETAFGVPANDDFSNPIIIPASLPFTNSQSTTDATIEASEQQPCGDIAATVWYSFTPSQTGVVRASTINSLFDTVLAVYTGATLPALNLVDCNDDAGADGPSAVQFTTSPGTTYLIQVGGYQGSTGSLSLNLEFGVPAINDAFSAALSVSEPLPYSDSRSTAVATREQDEPEPSCAPMGRSIWYAFSPAQTGTYRLSTSGSSFDTVLAVYSGTALDSLAELACNDDGPIDLTSEILTLGVAGESYKIQVGGYQGDSGTLAFSLEALSESDFDADGDADAVDNCPAWPNPTQALPLWTVPANDPDCDGFTTLVEAFVGTDAVDACNTTSTATDEIIDAWPSDFNDSRSTNLSDVILMGPSYNKSNSQAGYNARFDLNASNSVNLSDVILLGPFYNKSCS